MALQDRVQEETSERKNKLEAYIYSLRNKLSEALVEYVTDAEREDVSQRLEAAEVTTHMSSLIQILLSSLEFAPTACTGQDLMQITGVNHWTFGCT